MVFSITSKDNTRHNLASYSGFLTCNATNDKLTRFMEMCGCENESDFEPEILFGSLSHQDVQGYKWVRWRVWLCRLAALLSLGLLLLVFHWRPRFGVFARCKSCPPALADILLLRVR